MQLPPPPKIGLTSTEEMNQWLDRLWRAAKAGGLSPTGSLSAFAGADAPEGWLLCDGSAISRRDYADLFDVIGTTWGVGDGSTTFNLPDPRGRALIGVGAGSMLTARALADVGGAETHTLVIGEIPSHAHAEQPLSASTSAGTAFIRTGDASGGGSSHNTGSAGGGGAHNNMQPFVAVNMIIKA